MNLTVVFIILLFFIVGTIVWISITFKREEVDNFNKKAKEIGATEAFSIGKYITGLEGIVNPQPVNCAITEDNYIFLGSLREQLGKISKNAITKITVEDKTQISKRLTTVTRLALFGPFALALPKESKQEAYWLLIDWQDLSAVNHQTIFEFTGVMCQTLANMAASNLMKSLKSMKIDLATEEKKCPDCAENIKLEAKKCRFCGHLFDPEELEIQIKERQQEIDAKVEEMHRYEEKKKECPACGQSDIYEAYIEDGSIGDWCPHCKKSIQKISL
jgi:predicted RNA-binding Zn-ribbon protein involved in translation (DUF1610 family)